MSVIRMTDLLALMIASGEVGALPVRTRWPIHQAFMDLAHRVTDISADGGFELRTAPDPEVFTRVDGADEALILVVETGLLEQVGSGYTARWAVVPDAANNARRTLLREDPAMARAITQAGHRLATWASTVLKNVDTAAASWASTVTSSTPTVRQPPLLAVR